MEKLIKENNEMLRFICSYICSKTNPESVANEDLKDFSMNVIANIFADKITGNL